MRTIAVIVCCFFLSAFHLSCKKNKVQTPVPATQVRSAETLVQKLRKRETASIKRLNAQLKLGISGGDQQISANANLIWVKDSALWINVKKFGLEAVRALITKDSVYVLNRLEKTCSVKSLSALQKEYNMPGGFEMLELALLAKAWIPQTLNLQSDIKEERHRLSGAHEGVSLDYRIAEGSFLLQSETFIQQKDARVMSLSYDDYRKTPEIGMFPYLCSVHVFSPDSGEASIDINFTSVEINKAKPIRFEIPAHYSRAD